MVSQNTDQPYVHNAGTAAHRQPQQPSYPVTTSFPWNARVDTGVAREPEQVSDPIIASFLRNLRKEKAAVTQVCYAATGLLRIYTEIDSKSASALNKVYRAEAATQREFATGGVYLPAALVFEHRNRAFGGQEIRDEFLETGDFIRVW
jgi:hypothetical protein